MRVLFAVSIITALVDASGAPTPGGNTAKRNIDQHLAPHRYDSEKLLIGSDTDENSYLALRVVLKADDNNRT